MKKIKYLLILFAITFGISSVSASTITSSRTDDDLGVNKKWTIDDSNIDNVKATLRVDAKEKVYDYANILTDEEETNLYNSISDYVSKSNMDMVVLTTDLAYSEEQLETYATDFYDYNDFGLNFDLYSGVIIIINMNDYNRYYNIYTFGNAQLYYPYERCETILDDINMDMKNSNYYSALDSYVNETSSYYKSGIPDEYKNYYVDDMVSLKKNYTIPWLIAFLTAGIVTSITISILVSKNKMVKKASIASEYLNKESVNYTNRNDQFVTSHTAVIKISTSSGSGGGFSSSGSSGGGHGGGGGRSF